MLTLKYSRKTILLIRCGSNFCIYDSMHNVFIRQYQTAVSDVSGSIPKLDTFFVCSIFVVFRCCAFTFLVRKHYKIMPLNVFIFASYFIKGI